MSAKEYPNSFSSCACCEFFFTLACVGCEHVMALDTDRGSLPWSPSQPSLFKAFDFNLDFFINHSSRRKDQNSQIASTEPPTQASASPCFLLNNHSDLA